MRNKQYHSYLRFYVLALVVLASFLAGLFFGRSSYVQKNLQAVSSESSFEGKYTDKASDANFDLFWQVWDLVNSKYINKPVDQKKLLYGATQGLIDALEDPYSDFMDPEQTQSFKDQIDGDFEGIGAEITVENERPVVASVLPGTPAEISGLQAADIILKVDETDTTDLGLIETVMLIRGEKGSTVTLTVVREGVDDVVAVPIVRDTINIESVKYEILTDESGKKILHLSIFTFGEKTSDEFSEAVTEGLKESPDAIILDLRGNSGGLLNESVEVAGEFLESGSVVAVEEFSDGKKKEFKTSADPRLRSLPVVVLVNEGSASASEILAGALRDQNDISLIGKKTFGKGTVQEFLNLKYGSSLRISVAKWLTPNGTDINKEGLQVDFEVEQVDDDEENDEQLQKAIEEVL